MKDNFFLIVTALASALIAWVFWHLLGEYAVTTLLIIALITTIADNVKLRRNARHSRADTSADSQESVSDIKVDQKVR